MTILPHRERSKRRLEQRDVETSQQFDLLERGQQNSTASLEGQTLSPHGHSSTSQLQAEPPHLNLSQNVGLNSSLFGVHHHHAHTHNQRLAPNNCNSKGFGHSLRNENVSLRAHTALALGVDSMSKSRRGSSSLRPPVGVTHSHTNPKSKSLNVGLEDKYTPPCKKSKRFKTNVKSKRRQTYNINTNSGGPMEALELSFDYSSHQVHDNQHQPSHSKSGKSSFTYAPFIQSAGSTIQQSRQILIPTTSTMSPIAQHSPKILGGAQQKSGPGRRTESPESDVNSGDEHQSAASPGGCNSEDEHVPTHQAGYTEELENTFEIALKKELGLHIRQMEMDGSCLFRAIADQVYGNQDMHDLVRRQCIDYMAKNSDHFSQYVTEDFSTYLHRKRQLGCHGNHIEVQALSEMFSRPIEVYQYDLKPINIFHGTYTAESACPIRISYHRNTHYNSLYDPEKPTVGVGLGLSDYKPRLVEKNLLTEVATSSENYQIEQAMLDDKLRETDWEITDETIREQVAKESYAQWLQDCQKKKRRTPACTVTGPSCSWGSEETSNWIEKLSPSGSPSRSHANTHSPKEKPANYKGSSSSSKKSDIACGGEDQPSSSTDLSQQTSAFFDAEPFNVFNFNDNIDESEAVARAIAESQQEYINQVLKK